MPGKQIPTRGNPRARIVYTIFCYDVLPALTQDNRLDRNMKK
jgi:hypothetical protein